VRVFSSLAALAALMLTTVGLAEAVTYPAITISVPVSVSAPLPAGITAAQIGTFVFTVTCSSPKTSSFSGISEVTSVSNSTVANGRITFGPATVTVPMLAGLQSGATVTCQLTPVPNPGIAGQFLGGLTYDSSKMTAKIVLP
jgi:hypothetical protein